MLHCWGCTHNDSMLCRVVRAMQVDQEGRRRSTALEAEAVPPATSPTAAVPEASNGSLASRCVGAVQQQAAAAAAPPALAAAASDAAPRGPGASQLGDRAPSVHPGEGWARLGRT